MLEKLMAYTQRKLEGKKRTFLVAGLMSENAHLVPKNQYIIFYRQILEQEIAKTLKKLFIIFDDRIQRFPCFTWEGGGRLVGGFGGGVSVTDEKGIFLLNLSSDLLYTFTKEEWRKRLKRKEGIQALYSNSHGHTYWKKFLPQRFFLKKEYKESSKFYIFFYLCPH